MNPLLIDNDNNTIINGEVLVTLFLDWINDNESLMNYIDNNYNVSELWSALNVDEIKTQMIKEYLLERLDSAQDEENLIFCDVQQI